MSTAYRLPSGLAARSAAILRDVRFLAFASQALFVAAALAVGGWLVSNLLNALQALGLNLSFGFLQRTAGFVIGQGPAMERTDSFLRAYTVGLANSLQVIVVGLVLASLLGLLAGISLLSGNWLLRNVIRAYVEVMRNTPLLVQLFFLYFAVILQLPSLADRVVLGPVILSQRGVWLPRLIPSEGFNLWIGLAAAGVLIGIVLYFRRVDRRLRTGEETRPFVWAAGSLLIIGAAGWILAGGQPMTVEYARLEGLRMVGGTRLTPEFAGILFGLVLYTGAFIADIVRAGLLAVPYGQLEAARAIGLNELQVLRFVILPQALRVIVPPLTNQYLNLAKNSSLAIAVGFPDLYAVSKVIFSQSGQAVQTIAMMMFTYLVISLVISAVMNVINARLRIVER